MNRKTTSNSTYPKGGVSCSKDSFVVNQTLVFQIKFCGKNPHFAKPQNISGHYKTPNKPFNNIKIMQDFISQAHKNGVTLLSTGKCQFCGGAYQRGIFECMENYNSGNDFLNFNNVENHLFIFLSVDAHALQHPEIHGRWNNHFHLTRLHLILEKNINWDYKTSPILSDYLNEYKAVRPNEFLNPPTALNRGIITTKDFLTVTTAEECMKLIKKWAEEVYIAWKENHVIVSQIADGFLKKNNNEHKHHKKTTTR